MSDEPELPPIAEDVVIDDDAIVRMAEGYWVESRAGVVN